MLAELPLDPQLAACVLAAPRYGCVAEMLTVAAMLSVPSVFTRAAGGRHGVREEWAMRGVFEEEETESGDECARLFGDSTSDHLTLLRMWARERIEMQI